MEIHNGRVTEISSIYNRDLGKREKNSSHMFLYYVFTKHISLANMPERFFAMQITFLHMSNPKRFSFL